MVPPLRLVACAVVGAVATLGCPAKGPIAKGEDGVDRPQNQAPFGPCVEASADALRRLSANGEAPRKIPIDLDRDGAADPVVTAPTSCGSGGCVWELYVVRAGCARWVGELFGVVPRPLAEGQGELVDLLVEQLSGCAGMERVEVRARFDGKRYLPYETRACHCPDRPPVTDSSDASCDVWHPPTSP